MAKPKEVQGPRCRGCCKSLLGVSGNSCPGCGRALSIHDFALDDDAAGRRKHERDGTIGVVICVGLAIVASMAAAGGAIPPILAAGAWLLALASMGPKVWSKIRYRGHQLYQEDLEGGYSLDKNPRLRR